MCGKTETESIKHQLEALGVLRPKIAAIRRDFNDSPYVPHNQTTDATVADSDMTKDTEEVKTEA